MASQVSCKLSLDLTLKSVVSPLILSTRECDTIWFPFLENYCGSGWRQNCLFYSFSFIPATMSFSTVQVEPLWSDQQLVKHEGKADTWTKIFFHLFYTSVPSIMLESQELEMVEMQTVAPVSESWAKPGVTGSLAQVHCNTCTQYGQQRRP